MFVKRLRICGLNSYSRHTEWIYEEEKKGRKDDDDRCEGFLSYIFYTPEYYCSCVVWEALKKLIVKIYIEKAWENMKAALSEHSSRMTQ